MTAYEEHLVNNGWSPEEAAVMYQRFSDPSFSRDPMMMREYQPGFLSRPTRTQFGDARPVTVSPAYTQRIMQAQTAPIRVSPISPSISKRQTFKPRQQPVVAKLQEQVPTPTQTSTTPEFAYEPQRYLTADELKERVALAKLQQNSRLGWDEGLNLEGAYSPVRKLEDGTLVDSQTGYGKPFSTSASVEQSPVTVDLSNPAQPVVIVDKQKENEEAWSNVVNNGFLGSDEDTIALAQQAMEQVGKPTARTNAVLAANQAIGGATLLGLPWIAKGISGIWNFGKQAFKGTPKPASQAKRKNIRQFRKQFNPNEPVAQDFPEYESAYDTIIRGQANNPVWNIPGYIRYRNAIDAMNRLSNPNTLGSRVNDLRWILPN